MHCADGRIFIGRGVSRVSAEQLSSRARTVKLLHPPEGDEPALQSTPEAGSSQAAAARDQRLDDMLKVKLAFHLILLDARHTISSLSE